MRTATRPAGRRSPSVAAIVLAAGRSARMGVSKPLVRVGGKPLLEHALDAIRGSGISSAVVVLGHEAARVRKEVPLAAAEVVENPGYAAGISTSIRAGIHAAGPAAEAYLFVLADQPFVQRESVDAVLSAWRERRAGIVIPTFRGRRGNPVLVDRRLAAEIESLTGDVGVRALFGAHAVDLLEVAVDDPGILVDVDSARSLETLNRELDRGRPLRQILLELAVDAGTRGP